MFRNRTVSLVIPAYNEEETIAQVVEEFRQEPHLDEIVVVDNNCKDRTAELAAKAGARVVAESRPGYGAALMAGMDAAKGDLLVLVEADGSFRARDVVKLLVYLDDADMVMGTRTTRQMVEQGANMRFLLRWGNVFMAKFLQLCWLRPAEPRFTDVGCTFRALARSTFARIRPRLRQTGPAFSPEMMCGPAGALSRARGARQLLPSHGRIVEAQRHLRPPGPHGVEDVQDHLPKALPGTGRADRQARRVLTHRSIACRPRALDRSTKCRLRRCRIWPRSARASCVAARNAPPSSRTDRSRS